VDPAKVQRFREVEQTVTRRRLLVTLAWLCLVGQVGASMDLGRGVVLCVAPGDHVAFENGRTTAACSGGATEPARLDTSATIARVSCFDTALGALLPGALSAGRRFDDHSIVAPIPLRLSWLAAEPGPSGPPVKRSPLQPTALRFIRSVVLLI